MEVIDKYSEFVNQHRKIIENENDSQFEDYRDINHEDRTSNSNNKLKELARHQKLKNLNQDKFGMDFVGTISYPAALHDEKSTYPKIETGYAFTPHVNTVYVAAFSNEVFEQKGNECSFSESYKNTHQI